METPLTLYVSTRIEVKRPTTWGELYDAIREAGYGEDEYFSPFARYDYPDGTWHGLPLYDDKTRWIACFWVVGGSEGYYTHIERIYEDGRKLMLVGKFWDWQRAQDCANFAQRLVNS